MGSLDFYTVKTCNCWVVERRDMGGVVDDLDSHRCACSGGGIDGLRGLWGLGILMLSASLINKCKEKRRHLFSIHSQNEIENKIDLTAWSIA